jgi:hypothetical protein
MTARERIAALMDEGSFVELDRFVRHRCTNFGQEKKELPGEGVVCGYGTVDGRLVYAFAQDFTVEGGSLGEKHAHKIWKVQDLAMKMGMERKNIAICENGDAVEIGARSMKVVPALANAGEVFVDGYGVGDVGAVVLRDRKHLAEDGMLVVVLPVSAHNGDLLAEPEIVTRGFIYVKENEDIIDNTQELVREILANNSLDGENWPELKNIIKDEVHRFIFEKIKRNPMILPIILDV